MRILILNPNTSPDFTRVIQKAGEAVKSPETEVVCLNPSSGPRSIENVYDELLSCPPGLEILIAKQMTFDGFIIACFGNHPLIHAGRVMLAQPVIGIMEAALHIACFVGHKFSVISAGDRGIPDFEDAVKAFGLADRCASIRSTSTAVLAITGSGRATVEDAIIEQARKAIEQDGAEAICLGCAGMAGVEERIQRELGVPAIDGVASAVKLMEALIDCSLKTSKRGAYAPLTEKELVGLPPIFASPYADK